MLSLFYSNLPFYRYRAALLLDGAAARALQIQVHEVE